MKKLIKSFSLFIALFAFFILFPISTKAFDSYGDFDAVYYAAKYPDVVNALGSDEKVLYKHYLDFGIAEGRFPNAYVEANGSSGLTYIDVDIENQLVTYYENGIALMTSSCVTGDVRQGRSTPGGTYTILAKVKGKFLKGPTWNCWVDYWIRFTDSNIGLHDSSWRSKYGGDIYKTNGSHGCVNLPRDAAEFLFSRAPTGTMVIVRSPW